MNSFAPATDHNDTVAYANSLSKAVQVPSTTKSSEVTIRKRQLSDWDVAVYLRRDWNHFSELKNPFLTLCLLKDVFITQQVLLEASRSLSPEALNQLREAAQVQLDSLHVYMPGPIMNIQTLAERVWPHTI
jgi:hypothetical protein